MMNHNGGDWRWKIAEAGDSVKFAPSLMRMLLAQFLHMFHVVPVHLDFLQRDGHPRKKCHHEQAAENNNE